MANASVETKPTQQYQRNADKTQLPQSATADEERTLLEMYRELSRWEKNAVFLVMQSIAWGQLNADTTDGYSWTRLRKEVGLGKVVHHG